AFAPVEVGATGVAGLAVLQASAAATSADTPNRTRFLRFIQLLQKGTEARNEQHSNRTESQIELNSATITLARARLYFALFPTIDRGHRMIKTRRIVLAVAALLFACAPAARAQSTTAQSPASPSASALNSK